MKLLLRYLKNYKKLMVLALVLAAINTLFSLIDPAIFRHILDDYVWKFKDIDRGHFFTGVGGLILLAMGAAFVSRVAKNFQDYYTNVLTQRLGVQLYSEGVEHSLKLPYQVFEDQRSGETLGKLQKVRTDSERLINSFVNIIFTTLVGIIFVTVYAIRIDWIIAAVYFSILPLLATLSLVPSKKIK